MDRLYVVTNMENARKNGPSVRIACRCNPHSVSAGPKAEARGPAAGVTSLRIRDRIR